MINDQRPLFVAASSPATITLSNALSEIASARWVPVSEASGSATIAWLSPADSALSSNAFILDKRTTGYAIHNIHTEN